MEEEFEQQSGGLNFDFKGFLIRILSYWYLFLISIRTRILTDNKVNNVFHTQNNYNIQLLKYN